jgi:cytoskeletal protein CcmA (bactofilin family)
MFFGGNKQQKLDVIIGADSVIRGELTSRGAVRIDGTLEGNVTADCLIIGEKGAVTGDAAVRRMIIGGRIVGDIRAADSVDIQHKGAVCGDISSTRLTIAEGGAFDGRSTMNRTKELTYEGDAPAALLE